MGTYNELVGLGYAPAVAGLHYKCDEDSGTELVDSIDDNNADIISGTMDDLDVAGPNSWADGAIACDSSDYLEMSAGALDQIAGDDRLVVSFWYRDTGTGGYVMGWYGGSSNGATYRIQVNTNVFASYATRGTSSFETSGNITTPPTLDDGNWHHISVFADLPNSIEIWVDGVEYSGADITMSKTDSDSSMGSHPAAFRIGSINSGTVADSELSNIVFATDIDLADYANALYDGPEPVNTVLPTFSVTPTTFTGTVGTWDSQGNGALTYAWTMVRADTGATVASGSGSSISGSGTYDPGTYCLEVEATNDAGTCPVCKATVFANQTTEDETNKAVFTFLMPTDGEPVNLTIPGNGSVGAAVAIWNNASTTQTSIAEEGLGFFDGTDQRCQSSVRLNSSASSSDYRKNRENGFILYGERYDDTYYAASNITDGIQIRLSGTVDHTISRVVTVTLLWNVEAKLESISWPTTDGGTTSVSGLPFTPTAVLAGNLATNWTGAYANSFIGGFGVAVKNGNQFCFPSFYRESPYYLALTLKTDRLVSYVYDSGTAAEHSNLRLSSWQSDGITIELETVTGTPGATWASMVLIFGGSDVEFDVTQFNTPTATGDDSLAVGITPELSIACLTTSDAMDSLETGNLAEGAMFGITDGDNQVCYSRVSRYANPAGDYAYSVYNDDTFFDLYDQDDGLNNLVKGTCTGFDTDQIDYNLSAADATSRYGFIFSMAWPDESQSILPHIQYYRKLTQATI